MPLPNPLRALLVAALTTALACGGEGTTPTTTVTGTGGASSTTASGGSGGVLPDPKPLGVMNWNVHDFFDTVNDNPQGYALSSTDYKKKQEGIGGVIKSLDPDVVMLAEVEREHILDDMNANYLGGAYVNTTLITGNDTRGINVALLSKVEPDKVVSHKDDIFKRNGTNGPSYTYARDCLEVHLTFNGRKLVLLGVHFKAKLPTDDPDKRLAEAQHTRAIADALVAEDPSRAVIILGDYNDTPGTPPVSAVADGPPPFGDTADAVPEAQRHSFVFNGMPELIDHQFANPLAAGMLDPSTVVIKHGAGIDDGSKYASDHAPIFAVYRVR